MNDSPRRTACFFSLLLVLLSLELSVAQAQPPLYRIGAPYPPARDPNLTTDNGIPGTGSYYYRDYPWPSLREALQEYGLFGRRFRAHAAATETMEASSSPALIRVHLPADAELRLDGQATKQRGIWRRFVTPPLSTGALFEYEVEASWNEHGLKVRRTRAVRVVPGTEVVVDLLTAEEDSSTLPPPRLLLPR
ncbi:MAG TPA: TIGR03000 domain-containing protein [Gemmataceae bacterium]|nr:TIGR03000 domain-containing protein [Gemmataceae bacterium]